VDAAFLETSSEALRTARREKQDLGRSPGRSTQAGLQARTDLWYRFRDTDGPDRLVFLIWLLTYGCKEQHIQEPQLSVFRAEWKSALAAVENWPKRAWYRLLLAGMSASVAVRSMLPPAWARVPIVDAGWLGRRRTSESRPATDTIHPTSAKGPANGSAGQPPLGLNVVGYLRAETGMGESARSSIAAGRLAGIRVNVKSVQHSGCRNGDSDAGAKSEELSDELTNAVNLFHVNADQTRLVLDSIGDGLLAGRYNIGYWAWELEDFPDRWRSSFDRLHEIWTPSSFCQIAISKKSPIPVIRIPHSLDVRLNRSYPREYFGLPSKGFLYLVIFDVLSVFERKNPLGVIQAFARAFGAESDCHLVVKVNNAGHSPESMERLRAHLADLRATLLDDTFTRDEVNGLINICDCLVSLHRSEGFGLTMAEAMFLSKPVIATGYSGNLDFTRPDNSFLVGYRLCPVGAGCEPYDSHCLWADPNIDEAIQQMRAVFQNPEHRQNVAAKGQAYVHKYLSREAIGGQVRQRLDALRHRRSAQ
jgi:glycosyltransferase involved in cell wall biosynthesis